MKIASIIAVLLGTALAVYAAFAAGQLVLAGVLIALMYAVGSRKPRRRSVGPKAAVAKRNADEQRSEVPLIVAIMLPLALIAEKLDVQSRSVIGHHALTVYASAAWAYYGSDSSASESFGETAKAALLTGAIGAGALGFLTMDVTAAVAFILAIAVALETFAALRGSVPAAEAHLVAGLCLIVAVDCVTNNFVAPNPQQQAGANGKFKFDLKQTTGASLEHVMGRSLLVAAWLFAASLRRLFQTIKITAPAQKTVLATVVAIGSLTVSALHVYAALFAFAESPPPLKAFFEAALGDTMPSLSSFTDRTIFIASFRGLCFGIWIAVVPLACAVAIAVNDRVPKIVRRKAFHVLAVLAFIIPNVIDPQFLGFWWCVAISLSVVVETARVHGLLFTEYVTGALQRVIDERDSVVVRTHIYLIVGCALPVLLNYRLSFRFESKVPWFVTSLRDTLPGLGALGVLDAVAAAAGVWCGNAKLSWLFGRIIPEEWRNDNPALSHKSFVGTACGALAFWFFALVPLLIIHVVDMGSGSSGARLDAFAIPWPVILRVLGISVVTSIYEAVTEGVDNLELPIVCATVTRLFL